MADVVTDGDAFRETAAAAPPSARVPVGVRTTVGDPFDAYRRARDDAGGVYLGTTGGQDGWGYFATAPVEFVTVDPSDGPAIPALTDALATEDLARGGCSVPYPCGAVGWLSYDAVRDVEDLPSHAAADRHLPRLQIGVYDRIAAWEEPRGDEVTLRITACPRLDEHGDASAAYAWGREHALALADAVESGDRGDERPPVDGEAARFESDCTAAEYADRVRAVKRYVRDGETFQANVSQRLTAPATVHPVAVFDALRRVNPAPYSALVEFPGVDLVSASPELLFERVGDRIRTEPIAGTRPRGETPAADAELAAALTGDEKERAEHAMLVDLERNDLGKVAEFGSVEVIDYRRVDRYSEVMHLVSNVEARLRADADLGGAIGARFPGGTITGAPKPRTMAIIDELEGTRRGPYTGSIGIFGFDGRATMNIAIRTLVRYRDEYHLRVGAGIVHDSVPEREYDETLDKARALVTAVDEALGQRASMRVEGNR